MSARHLLADCLTLLCEDRDVVLRSECRIDEAGRPDRSTMPREIAPYITRRDLLITKIEARLADTGTSRSFAPRRGRA